MEGRNKSRSESVSACDRELKSGNLKSAEKILRQILGQYLTRAQVPVVAQLCRRARLFEEGLKILAPLVRSRSGQAAPLPKEVSEYAILLSWIGSQGEALELLNTVSVADVPDVHLNRAYCHILQWDYPTAARELLKAIDVERDPYRLLICKVNLAAALINDGRLEQAMALTNQNIQAATKLNASRLLGNSYQLRAQIWISLGELVHSRRDLETAGKILKDSSWDQLLVKKWVSILRGMETCNVEPIEEFRAEAVRTGLWESVREADYYSLRVRFDERVYNHLYFGTPFEAYRARMRIEFLHEPGDFFLFGNSTGPVFDASSGDSQGGSGLPNPGSKICQLIQVLSMDLYAPPRLGKVFSYLYPNEHFNVYSSPHRVHQLILRCREWMSENQTGFQIRNLGGHYRLVADGACALKITARKRIVDEISNAYDRLSATFPAERTFSSAEGAKVLQMSSSNFTRYAKALQEKGLVERLGAARFTRYRIRKAS